MGLRKRRKKLVILEKRSLEYLLETHQKQISHAKSLITLSPEEQKKIKAEHHHAAEQLESLTFVRTTIQNKHSDLLKKIEQIKVDSQNDLKTAQDLIAKIDIKDLYDLKIKKDSLKLNKLFKFLNESIFKGDNPFVWKKFKENYLNKKKKTTEVDFKAAIGTFTGSLANSQGSPDLFSKATQNVNKTLVNEVVSDTSTILSECQHKGKDNSAVKALTEYVAIVKRVYDRESEANGI